MTTSTLNVGDPFSVLGAHGIEKQLRHVVGVGRDILKMKIVKKAPDENERHLSARHSVGI